MRRLYKFVNDSLIELYEISFPMGRTITEYNILLSMSFVLKSDLQRRLKRFLRIESPYFFETISPKHGPAQGTNLKDKSPIFRDFDAFIM